RLEEIFAHFPGIGPRQARRFVYYLQSRTTGAVKELADLIREVRDMTTECSGCHRFFIDSGDKSLSCKICADSSRDRSTLMVVARDSDFETIEKSGAYRGQYFILGGTVPLLDKEPEKRIRLNALLKKIAKDKLEEVILSLNATPDGENTADIVKSAIIDMTSDKTLYFGIVPLRLTLLGRGLSTGAELEYVDADTIKNALLNRH
ncbi:MAG: toprim domain-containing protein, partial [Candidatus Taylorbacteria bacterium]|nr:toprim domain-containing protein [Candidatus Taylorbacteria bacterium]